MNTELFQIDFYISKNSDCFIYLKNNMHAFSHPDAFSASK